MANQTNSPIQGFCAQLAADNPEASLDGLTPRDGLDAAIKPVIFSNGGITKVLSYDEYNKTVRMDAVSIDELTLSDFKRIHTFFRKVMVRKFRGRENGKG